MLLIKWALFLSNLVLNEMVTEGIYAIVSNKADLYIWQYLWS